MRGERVLALVIDNEAGNFRFGENLRPRIFFNWLLRWILSEKPLKDAGVPRYWGTHPVRDVVERPRVPLP